MESKLLIANEVVHINPRYVNVSDVSRPGKFAIKNISEGKNIYFKIKRCEDTIAVDYNPKYGCVQPGNSVDVNLKLVEGGGDLGSYSNHSKVRLYVKMVVLDLSAVESSFKANWQKGSDGLEVLKKLVEVNTSKSNVSSPAAYDSSNRSRLVASPSLSVGNDDNLSVLSESIDNFNYVGNGKKNGGGGEHSLDESNLSDSLTTVSTAHSFANNSQSRNTNLGMGLRGGAASLVSLNKGIVQDVSCLSPIATSSGSKSGDDASNLMLHIEGEAASNSVIADAVSLRLTDSLSYSSKSSTKRSRVVAIEVCNTPMSSLQFSVCNIFEPSKRQDEAKDEVSLMKRALLVDNVRSLTCNNNFKLQYIDNSVNSLVNLKYLDLSRNEIQTIASLINLPNLIGLNLSYNKLTSLDFLQLLISLQWLVVSNNNISNLKNSINLLVPLSQSLTTVDLSNNPVASQNNYVDEVFAILPNLKIFHGKNLATLKSFANSFQDDDEASTDSVTSDASFQNTSFTNVNSKQDRNFEYRIKRALKRVAINEKRSVVQTGKINAVIASRNPTPVKAKVASPQLKVVVTESSSFSHYDSAKVTNSAPVIVTESMEKSHIPFISIDSDSFNNTNKNNKSVQRSNNEAIPAYMQDTDDSKQRRKSQFGLLIEHWGGHHKSQSAKVAGLNEISMRSQSPTSMRLSSPRSVRSVRSVRSDNSESKLLHGTKGHAHRRASFGIALDTDAMQQLNAYNNPVSRSHNFVHLSNDQGDTSRGYFSEGETSSMRKSFRDQSMTIDAKTFLEMQEDPRYSKWNSRYRVPKPIFGYSKPFKDRPDPSVTGRMWPHANGFVQDAKRVQEGFQKIRTGGTFTRAAKGLPPEFYPMDIQDVEAIQRQGFFHDTIGTVCKFHTPHKNRKKSGSSSSQDDSHLSYSGSVVIAGSVGKVARRASLGPHISRQYKSISSPEGLEMKYNPATQNHWITGSSQKKLGVNDSGSVSLILPNTPNFTGTYNSNSNSISSSNNNNNNNNHNNNSNSNNNSNNNSSNINNNTNNNGYKNYSNNKNTGLAKLFNNSVELSENESIRSIGNSIDSGISNMENRYTSDTVDQGQENKLLNYMKWLDTAVLASSNADADKNNAGGDDNAFRAGSSDLSSSPSLLDLANGSFR